MKQRRGLKYAIAIGWFVVGLAIVLVATLIVPKESRSDYFWHRVVWTEVLSALLWGSAAFFFVVSAARKDSVKRLGGIAPTVSFVTATYSVLSFTAMAVHAVVPGSDTGNRLHWVLQIVFFTVVALSVVFLSISRTTATSGFGFDRAKVATPKELHDLLAACELSLRSPLSHALKASMKKLRETLVYSLNESASLAELPDYQELCRRAKALCDSVAGLATGNEEGTDRFNPLNESAIALTIMAKIVSAKQVRR